MENVKITMENVMKDPLPHHEQQELCTSRLPYRQGRKLTAVKVYTISTESNHLLIFGVPSINLRQETKTLFMKFGKLTQFSLIKDYKCEKFTETYHAVYENIKSARIAKKMLDTKNFYGSNLHICYAPELESVQETSNKIFQRKKDVLNRLKNLNKEDISVKQISAENPEGSNVSHNSLNTTPNSELSGVTLNMGNENIIYLNSKKRKLKPDSASASMKKDELHNYNHNHNEESSSSVNKNIQKKSKFNHNVSTNDDNIEIVDFTSTKKETITNIDEALNYNKFGNEIIKKVNSKPMNVIKFNFNKNL